MSSPSPGTPGKPSGASLWQKMPASGRAFLYFWGGCTALAGVVALTLQIMGPPYAEVSGDDIDVGTTSPAAIAALASKTDIPAPMGDLLTSDLGPGGFALPKVGPHGLLPRQVYAAPAVPVPAGNAQVALVIDGIGQSDDELSNQAIDNLPGPVSLAISPYASDPSSLMDRARTHNHETLLSLPMQDSPADGKAASEEALPNALQASLSERKNIENLNETLSHLAGYAGVTNAFSGQNGGEYPHSPAFKPILSAVHQRGLFYLNATPATTSDGPGLIGTADVAINTDADIVTIDIQLLRLQQLARKNGRAIGVIGPLRPVALSCLKAWIPHLTNVGITLVPVSMLVAPLPAPPPAPAKPPAPPPPTAATGAMHVNVHNATPNAQNGPTSLGLPQ
ncbi:divergent polysaccharide deacetylase family protein [Acetobacter sp. P5B1]|uniref:divergent polysaccharide deacetylase family protein n=1 Tax=Acetobacter sp. P5B1 TaxID=2762620 RepID=UPI001C03D501|nr:divergent polysaccharide deacetylase family protein [Acetobacter sp. P5B1]